MFKILIKKWIKNYNDVNNSQVREKYGTLCSTLSIVCNIVLVIFKFTIGVITNSIAIQADGLNNLSDVGSNLASLFGFKLANKHPDETHPYGHGRGLSEFCGKEPVLRPSEQYPGQDNHGGRQPSGPAV